MRLKSQRKKTNFKLGRGFRNKVVSASKSLASSRSQWQEVPKCIRPRPGPESDIKRCFVIFLQTPPPMVVHHHQHQSLRRPPSSTPTINTTTTTIINTITTCSFKFGSSLPATTEAEARKRDGTQESVFRRRRHINLCSSY